MPNTKTVEGDLNRSERREIGRVLKTVDKMMKNLVAGRLDPMMAQAGQLKGLKTIEGLELGMSGDQDVAVTRESRSAVLYDANGVPGASVGAATSGTGSVLESLSRSVALDMAREVATAEAPMDRLRDKVDGLLNSYQEQAGRRHAAGGRIVKYIRTLFKAVLAPYDQEKGGNAPSKAEISRAA